MNFMFTMSCGHEEEREVAEPKKYLNLDREYYSRQGLCSVCWEKLREKNRHREAVAENN